MGLHLYSVPKSYQPSEWDFQDNRKAYEKHAPHPQIPNPDGQQSICVRARQIYHEQKTVRLRKKIVVHMSIGILIAQIHYANSYLRICIIRYNFTNHR